VPKERKLGPKGTPFFATPTTFEKAYPDIEEIEITVESMDKKITTKEPEVSYHWRLAGRELSDLPAYVSCGNPLCNEGGFGIQKIVDSVYPERLTEGEGAITCRGHEHMGRWQQRACLRGASYKIRAQYKSSQTST